MLASVAKVPKHQGKSSSLPKTPCNPLQIHAGNFETKSQGLYLFYGPLNRFNLHLDL